LATVYEERLRGAVQCAAERLGEGGGGCEPQDPGDEQAVEDDARQRQKYWEKDG
jgi:hypothetical protein